jgi:hypothetical protein
MITRNTYVQDAISGHARNFYNRGRVRQCLSESVNRDLGVRHGDHHASVTMFFDLNVPIPSTGQSSAQGTSKKGKGKQQAFGAASVTYTASQIDSVEARIDVLVRCKSHSPCRCVLLSAILILK